MYLKSECIGGYQNRDKSKIEKSNNKLENKTDSKMLRAIIIHSLR